MHHPRKEQGGSVGLVPAQETAVSALRGKRAECRVRTHSLGAACAQAVLGSHLRVWETTGLGAGAGCRSGARCPGRTAGPAPSATASITVRKSQVGGLGNPSQSWMLPKSLILGRGGDSLGALSWCGAWVQQLRRRPWSHLLGAHPSGSPYSSAYRTVRSA